MIQQEGQPQLPRGKLSLQLTELWPCFLIEVFLPQALGFLEPGGQAPGDEKQNFRKWAVMCQGQSSDKNALSCLLLFLDLCILAEEEIK